MKWPGIGISPMFSRGGVDAISESLSFYYKFNGNAARSYGTYDAGTHDVTYSAGAIGQCAVFNGTTSHMNIDDSSDFDFNGTDFTIGVLIKPTNVNGTTQSFFGQNSLTGASEFYGFLLRISAANKFVALIKTDETAVSFVTLTSSSDVLEDVWQLVIVKREGNNYTLKVNDVIEDTDTNAFNYQNSIYKVGVGISGEYKGGQFTYCEINAAFGWKRALTSDEESDLYNGGNFWLFRSPSPTSNQDALQAKMLDAGSIGFSSFQSHNQKVVTNQYGTFVSYSYSATSFPLYDYKILRTQDNGVSWTEIADLQSYTEPMAILETDSSGNIYAISCKDADEIRCIKYSAPNFTAGTPVDINGFVAHKYAAYLDEANDRIYFMMKNVFLAMDMDFNVIEQDTILAVGATYGEEYPSITCGPDGTVYLVWTTAIPDMNSGYRSIQCMKNDNLGNPADWTALDGTAITIPQDASEDGDTTMINTAGELGTQLWLSSFTYANERLHCVYWFESTPMEQHYVRVNPTTGAREVPVDEILGNVPVKFPDGVLVRVSNSGTHASPNTLYFITSNDYVLTSTQSTDNGATWGSQKVVSQSLLERIYSVSGFRDVYDSKCVGVFTNTRTWDPITELYTANYSGYTYSFSLDI